MNISHSSVTAGLFCVTTLAHAAPVAVQGTINAWLTPPNQTQPALRFPQKNIGRPIKLLDIHLSNTAQQHILQKLQLYANHPGFQSHAINKLPERVNLGMNGVPVLDQGAHGTCATFAITAGIDAILGKGDFISQLCQLQVGKSLAAVSYFPNGWHGSLGEIILRQMQSFGIVSMDKQHENGCGGLTDYPTKNADTGTRMPLADFRKLSDNIAIKLQNKPIVTVYQFAGLAEEQLDSNRALKQVKQALAQGDRVAFGMLLLPHFGTVGATGSYRTPHDTWTLSPDIKEEFINITQHRSNNHFAGHEMIIFGYDDHAEVKEDDGSIHHGIFMLRNSWSDKYGDQGNFYVTYDYFDILTIEATQLQNPKKNIET